MCALFEELSISVVSLTGELGDRDGARYSLSDSEERPRQRGLYFYLGLMLDFPTTNVNRPRDLRAGKIDLFSQQDYKLPVLFTDFQILTNRLYCSEKLQ